MANLWGLVQSTVNNAKKKWAEVTITKLKEGTPDERRGLDVVNQASEEHIGEIGGNTKLLRMNPAIQTSLYASGKCIGGLIELTDAMRKNGGTGLISNLVASIASNSVYPSLEINIFSDNPTSSTVGDNQTYVVAAADLGKRVAIFNINKSDYILTGGTYRAKSGDGYQGVESISTSQKLYAVIVAKEDVTFPSDHALFIKSDALRD